MKSLKEIRNSCGLSQKELSKKIGVTQQQYSRYEVGVNKITLEMYLKILNACGYKLNITKK